LLFAVAGLDDASPVHVVTAASRHASCLRLGVFRPRPPARTEPIGQSGHYGRTRHDRPDPRTVSSDQAPLLRFGPLQRTSAVSRAPKAAGLRIIPLRRFALAAPALLRTSVGGVSPLRFFAAGKIALGTARSGGRSGWVVRSSQTCRAHRTFCAPCAGHAFVDRQDATPVVCDPPDGCGRRNRCARFTAGSVQSSVAAGDFVARAGSCTDASFSAVFRYPSTQACRAAQPDERFFPLSLARRHSWGCALRRFDPTDRWSTPHACGG